ncbi:hypothetical protein [Heyndrickxia acidicola]|uniref:Uncharacterized protein n=1 Tax=Heyndrickxia acidicola TaxID=209389 RepID=A0ABU6MGD3_9BACI|nr:hypothetical protein [Heyndrickxia acidicola]MED1203484.1 hypothetical protein [Heyndrickxia acidicola]
MMSEWEYLLIARELGRLLLEYEFCSDTLVKNNIHQDILLLVDALTLTAILI